MPSARLSLHLVSGRLERRSPAQPSRGLFQRHPTQPAHHTVSGQVQRSAHCRRDGWAGISATYFQDRRQPARDQSGGEVLGTPKNSATQSENRAGRAAPGCVQVPNGRGTSPGPWGCPPAEQAGSAAIWLACGHATQTTTVSRFEPEFGKMWVGFGHQYKDLRCKQSRYLVSMGAIVNCRTVYIALLWVSAFAIPPEVVHRCPDRDRFLSLSVSCVPDPCSHALLHCSRA